MSESIRRAAYQAESKRYPVEDLYRDSAPDPDKLRERWREAEMKLQWNAS